MICSKIYIKNASHRDWFQGTDSTLIWIKQRKSNIMWIECQLILNTQQNTHNLNNLKKIKIFEFCKNMSDNTLYAFFQYNVLLLGLTLSVFKRAYSKYVHFSVKGFYIGLKVVHLIVFTFSNWTCALCICTCIPVYCNIYLVYNIKK